MLTGKNLSFSYDKKNKDKILNKISFSIEPGDFIGLIGTSGSGKTTLVKHLNGLLKADSGELLLDGVDLYKKKKLLRQLKNRVGLVFQYPENQLFESTVLKDVMFGPLNQGLSEEKAKEVASESLRMLGISEKFYESNPLDLSGGQKRCIAIAGIIAMKPDILVLDEPTAGLDFKSKNLLFTVLKKIQAEKKSIVLVSHNIEDIAAYANKVWVLHDNQFVLSGDTRKVFNESTVLKKIGLELPQATDIIDELKQKGYGMTSTALNVDEAKEQILNIFSNEG